MPIEPIQQKRVYQRITEQLYNLISEGEFAVDQKLPGEHSLAKQLGVSRPTVREALLVLEATGIIEIVNGAGSYVRQAAKTFRGFSWEQEDSDPGPMELFRARYLLEPVLAAEATRFITDDEILGLECLVDHIDELIVLDPRLHTEHMQFHEQVAEAARNLFLFNSVRELLAHSRSGEVWKKVRIRIDDQESLEQGQQMRRKLISAFKRRDSNAASAALKQHFLRIGKACFGDNFDKTEISPTKKSRVSKSKPDKTAIKNP